MKLDGRRQSTNVEDRRGMSGGAKVGGIGLGGIIIVGLIWLLTGNAPDTQVLQQMTQGAGTEYASDGRDYSQVDVELMTFCKQILAGTEDVWTQEFRKMGRTYQPPKMVVFSGAVNSGCGSATSDSGPFYCSADQTVYLDLEFFKSMKNEIGADGDFAYAYVIAHEVGHHVQYLLGTLDAAHEQMARYGKNSKGYNQTNNSGSFSSSAKESGSLKNLLCASINLLMHTSAKYCIISSMGISSCLCFVLVN